MTDRNNDSSTEAPELKQWQTPSVSVLDVKETEGGPVPGATESTPFTSPGGRTVFGEGS